MTDLPHYLERLRSSLDAHGWVIQAVAPGRYTPALQYTLGLWPVAGFELVTAGLDPLRGGLILDDLADRVAQGTRFTHGQILTDVLAGGYDVALLQISDARAWLKIAALLYADNNQALPAWQVIYPDTNHHLPWHRDYTGPDPHLLTDPPN